MKKKHTLILTLVSVIIIQNVMAETVPLSIVYHSDVEEYFIENSLPREIPKPKETLTTINKRTRIDTSLFDNVTSDCSQVLSSDSVSLCVENDSLNPEQVKIIDSLTAVPSLYTVSNNDRNKNKSIAVIEAIYINGANTDDVILVNCDNCKHDEVLVNKIPFK